MRGVGSLLVVLATLVPRAAIAVPLEALDLTVDWQLRALRIRGNDALSTRELERAMTTKGRPWFAVWRHPPVFDPVSFRTDLDRLRQLYRSRGWYEARVAHDLELPAEGRALVAVVSVDEGPRVEVARVDVRLDGVALAEGDRQALLRFLPIRPGLPFTQDGYDAGFAYLGAWYREHGHARVAVTKAAHVRLDRHTATVRYAVASGPACTFGETVVAGTRDVDAAVVRRELAWAPGDRFRQSRIEQTRANLSGLNLFRLIRVDEQAGDGSPVDMRVRVEDMPPREIRLGIGYDTEEQARVLASWRHYDFLGGARQLGFTARASLIERAIAADFLQPHFPGARNRTRLLFAQAQEEEDAFTLDRTRLSPRLEWQASPHVTGFASYRIEYDGLTSVRSALRRRFPGIAPRDGLLSGLGLGIDWNRTDDLLDPTRGFILRGTFEPIGGVFGGDFAFVRGTVEGRLYRLLVRRLGVAARLRLGTAEPTDGSREVPLFERFYAGGINSVRGYGRWRIGPLVDDEPAGGRSVLESSVELRHPIVDDVSGVVFVDGGQVSPRSLTFPVRRLAYGTGLGVRYKSPVGALGADLGFPLDPPPGDQRWQLHVSLGASF
jgi:outer membrane protein assembly complex protein YaeT